MKKSSKIFIASLSTVIGATAIIGGATAAIITNNQQTSSASTFVATKDIVKNEANNQQVIKEEITTTTTTTSSKPVMTYAMQRAISIANSADESEAVSIKTTFNEQTQTYTLTLINHTQEFGTVTFANGQTTMTASQGEKVTVKAIVTNPEYTLGTLIVYGDNQNIMLEVKEIENTGINGTYEFTIPQPDENGEMWFPVTNTITVKAFFIKKQLKSWKYDFNQQAYVFQLQQDVKLSENQIDEDLVNIANDKRFPTKFRIDLNGHNLIIDEEFQIPSGCNVIFGGTGVTKFVGNGYVNLQGVLTRESYNITTDLSASNADWPTVDGFIYTNPATRK